MIARDTATGRAEIAWTALLAGEKTASFYRAVVPALGGPARLPESADQYPVMAARVGGGVYSAYSPDGTKVVLTKLGKAPKAVPLPPGTLVKAAGVFAGPRRRLWVAFGSQGAIWATRTNKAVSRFEPLQSLGAPAGAFQLLRLEGEGSTGPLDLFADVAIDGKTKDGSYFRLVRPVLSMGAAVKAVRDKKGTLKAYVVTVRVTDAGDPIGAASVTGLPGGPRKTGAAGTVVVTVPVGQGTLALSAAMPGYIGARTSAAV